MLGIYTVGMVFVGKYFFEKHYHISATSSILTLNSFEVQRYPGVYDMQSYILNQRSKWWNTTSSKSHKSKRIKSNTKSPKLAKSSKDIEPTDILQPKNHKTPIKDKEYNEEAVDVANIDNDVEKPYNKELPSKNPNSNIDISLGNVNSVNNVNNVNRIKKERESSLSQTNENEIVDSNEISTKNKKEKHHNLKDNHEQNDLPISIF